MLHTEDEVSKILNCTKAALRRWRREGRGPRWVKMGRLVRYHPADIDSFIKFSTEGPNTMAQVCQFRSN